MLQLLEEILHAGCAASRLLSTRKSPFPTPPTNQNMPSINGFCRAAWNEHSSIVSNATPSPRSRCGRGGGQTC